jgi:hypothetical protein
VAAAAVDEDADAGGRDRRVRSHHENVPDGRGRDTSGDDVGEHDLHQLGPQPGREQGIEPPLRRQARIDRDDREHEMSIRG